MSYRHTSRTKPRKKITDRRSGSKPAAGDKATASEVRACERKRRHSDEATARLAGMEAIEQHRNVDALYVYQCPVCHGWHLTRFKSGSPVVVDDPVYEPTQEDAVMDVIRGGPVTSYFGVYARTDRHRWIHRACLQLEQQGRIERSRQGDGLVVWCAAAGVSP